MLYDAGYKPPGFEDVPVDDLAEVTVRGTKPTELDFMMPIPDLSNQFIRAPYDKPLIDEVAPEDIREFKIETKRPTELDLVAPPFNIPKTTIPDTGTTDLPEGPIEEVVVEGKRPSDLDIVAPPFTIPTKTPFTPPKEPTIKEPTTTDRLKGLLDKYGTLENLAKIAALAGGVKGGGGGTGGTGGMYDPRAGSASGQWIDWEKVKADADAAGMNLNTYTARNWNKIQNRALEAGMAQPSVASYNVPGSTLPENFDLVKYLEDYQPDQKAMGGMAEGSRVRGPGSGREDLIPALLSDGEYVIDAETMALLGDGSVDKAADMMDEFREKIRKHKGSKLAKGGISPNAKSPLQYLTGK